MQFLGRGDRGDQSVAACGLGIESTGVKAALYIVVPAQAGTPLPSLSKLVSRLRENDKTKSGAGWILAVPKSCTSNNVGAHFT
jgi:hypothetical protein